MGSAYQIYSSIFDKDEYDIAAMVDSSSDDEVDDGGHPFETKEDVLKQLADGFAYNKGGPAREYEWSQAEISHMAGLIRDKNDEVRKNKRKNRPRAIRAQNYRGETSHNYLLNWVNSVRVGKRFPENPNLVRGSKWLHGQRSNHQLWETVSEILTAEFHYWMRIHKLNLALDPKDRKKVRYPLVEDLIFRVNDDFTGGLWSQFYKYWEPFINELR